MIAIVVLGMLAFLSGVLVLWQWWASLRFPLHQVLRPLETSPGITLLKPLKGLEESTRECLLSWLQQDYPGPVQMLCGVASSLDPACDIVRKLIQENPAIDIQLVVCDPSLGTNAKVSTLIQIERLARYEAVVISDADVLAPPHLLGNLSARFAEHQPGLVNCFYRLATPGNAAMRWEAVAINGDFWSQVLQSRTLAPLDFALGAVMATTRSYLRKIGGFAVLKDYLADDYMLGHLIARQGGIIELDTTVVSCHAPAMGWREVWKHQLRWACTIRSCKPLPYFFSILSNGTVWPLLFWMAHCTLWTTVFSASLLLLRMVTAAHQQNRLNRSNDAWAWLWMALVKDLLQSAQWAISLVNDRVEWRGRTYRLRRGGCIELVEEESRDVQQAKR